MNVFKVKLLGGKLEEALLEISRFNRINSIQVQDFSIMYELNDKKKVAPIYSITIDSYRTRTFDTLSGVAAYVRGLSHGLEGKNLFPLSYVQELKRESSKLRREIKKQRAQDAI